MYNIDPEFEIQTTLAEDLEEIGIRPRKNKKVSGPSFFQEDFSHLAKLRNPFEDQEEEMPEEHEEAPEGEEAPMGDEPQEGDEHADAEHDEMGDHAEPDGDEDMEGHEPQEDGEEAPEEEEEPLPLKKPAPAPALASSLNMGESRLVKRSKALVEQAKSLVNQLTESERVDAFKGFAQIALNAEATARGFIKLSRLLDEEDLRGVAKSFKILAENAGNVAFALHEKKVIKNLEESFKNQLSMLLNGLRLLEDITEMCQTEGADEEGDEDEDEKHMSKRGNKVHIDVVDGVHNTHDHKEIDSDDDSDDDDQDVEEENLY